MNQTSQNASDVQREIDALLAKLDAAKGPGEVAQLNHSLRIKVMRKQQLGGSLSPLERSFVAAAGGDFKGASAGAGLVKLVILLVVLAIAGAAAYRFLPQ